MLSNDKLHLMKNIIITALLFIVLMLVGKAAYNKKYDRSDYTNLHIEKKEAKIEKRLTTVSLKKEVIVQYKDRRITLNDTLIKYKEIHDTVMIISIQDTLIKIQTEEIKKYEEVVDELENVVKDLKVVNILQKQDNTSLYKENQEKDSKIKKLKKQRTGLIAITTGAILSTVLTLKLLVK